MLLVCDNQRKDLAKLLDVRVSDNFWVFGHILPGAQLLSVIAAIKSKAQMKAGGNLFLNLLCPVKKICQCCHWDWKLSLRGVEALQCNSHQSETIMSYCKRIIAKLFH